MRALLLALTLTACSSPSIAPRDCTPGQTAACDCPGGGTAVQLCGTDGRLGACMCPDAGELVDVVAPDAPEVDVVVPDTSCGTGRVRCGAACVDTLADGTNCGTCGRVCGTSSRCVSGTCLEGDAGTVQDAGGMDAAVNPVDVPAAGSDVLLGGEVVCRTAEQPILRRCNSDNDCEACAPFTSGLPWCCRGTGYCENTSACRGDAGRFVPDARVECGNPDTVFRCRAHEDCQRACLLRPERVWCCSSGGECGPRAGTGCGG